MADEEELIFEEPPPPHAAGNVRAWLDALRSHPGEWAKYPAVVSQSVPSQVKNRGYGGAKPGEFEVRSASSGLPPARCHLYARYIGGES